MVIRKIFLRSTKKIPNLRFSQVCLVLKKMLSKLVAKFKIKFADGWTTRRYILITHSTFEVCAYVIRKWCYVVLTNSYRYFGRRSATETLVIIYHSPRLTIPEDLNLQEHRYLKLKSHNANKYFLTCQISHSDYCYRIKSLPLSTLIFVLKDFHCIKYGYIAGSHHP